MAASANKLEENKGTSDGLKGVMPQEIGNNLPTSVQNEAKMSYKKEELNRRQETLIAFALFDKADLLPSIGKISELLIELITKRMDDIIKHLDVEINRPGSPSQTRFQALQEALYGSEFAALKKPNEITKQSVIASLLEVLKSKSPYISNVICPQTTALYYLIKPLFELNEFKKMVSEAKDSTAEVEKTKSYFKFKDNLTQHLGLSKSFDFSKLGAEHPQVAKHQKLVQSGVIVNNPHRNSLFCREYDPAKAKSIQHYLDNNLPFAAGASTHTRDTLITLQLAFGNKISDDELLQYCYGLFVFDAIAGFHSYTEVMSVAHFYLKKPYSFTENYLLFAPNVQAELQQELLKNKDEVNKAIFTI